MSNNVSKYLAKFDLHLSAEEIQDLEIIILKNKIHESEKLILQAGNLIKKLDLKNIKIEDLPTLIFKIPKILKKLNEQDKELFNQIIRKYEEINARK